MIRFLFILLFLFSCTNESNPLEIQENNLKGAASLIVSSSGSGRVVLFADNPNFRGSWYGTNKLFLNAIFFGANISVPK